MFNQAQFSEQELADLPASQRAALEMVQGGEYTGESSNDTSAEAAVVLNEERREIEIPEVDVEDTAAGKPAWGAPMRAVALPKGVPGAHFRDAIAGAYREYMETGTWTNEGVVKWTNLTNAQVARVATTPEFKAALAIRGVVGGSSGLTAEQDHALMVLTAPDGQSLDKKLKQLKISHAKYRAWMKHSAFRKAMETVTQGYLHDNAQSLVMLEALSNNGDLKAIQYKHLLNGTFDPNRQQNIDAQALISEVFTILVQEVSDASTIERIASRLQGLNNQPKTIEGKS